MHGVETSARHRRRSRRAERRCRRRPGRAPAGSAPGRAAPTRTTTATPCRRGERRCADGARRGRPGRARSRSGRSRSRRPRPSRRAPRPASAAAHRGGVLPLRRGLAAIAATSRDHSRRQVDVGAAESGHASMATHGRARPRPRSPSGPSAARETKASSASSYRTRRSARPRAGSCGPSAARRPDPGTGVLTFTPAGPTSKASVEVRPMTAILDAQYGVRCDQRSLAGHRGDVDHVTGATRRPCAGRNALQIRKIPRTLMSNTSSQSSTVDLGQRSHRSGDAGVVDQDRDLGVGQRDRPGRRPTPGRSRRRRAPAPGRRGSPRRASSGSPGPDRRRPRRPRRRAAPRRSPHRVRCRRR